MTNTKRKAAIEKNVAIRESLVHLKAETSLHCYLRVSTQGQVDDGSSIESQRSIGKKIASKLGLKYVEMNEGGKSSSSGVRPMLENLKQGIREGEIKQIWYYSRSRWMRTTLEDALMKKNYFKRYKTIVYEGESGSLRNFNDAKDEFFDTMLTAVQQFDAQQRSEVSINGKMHRSREEGKNGVFMGGTINFGYANVDKKWTVNKDEAKAVKTIFSMYSQGKSLNEIKSYLDSSGVTPRRTSVWNIGTLLKMLQNRVYLGEYLWKDKNSGEEFEIRFEEIITQSIFNKVQKQIQKNRKHRGSNARLYPSLLSDFLVCSCGERILGNVKKSVNLKVYVCSSLRNKWKGKEVSDCINRRTMNMDLTDEFVLSSVKKVMGNSSVLKEKFKDDVLSKKSIDSQQIEIETEFLEKRIKKINYQLDLTIKSISTNEVNHMLMKTEDAVFEEIKKTLEEEKGSLEDKKSALVKEIEDLDNRKDWVDWITKYGDDISKKFNDASTDLLNGMIDTIKVTPTFAFNRDEVEKQVGHKLTVNFKQAIVGDTIVYEDEQKKSKGYNVIKGKKMLNVGTLNLPKGGRGNTAKKNPRN
jgi:site-specific DNA recombinase